MKITPWNNTLAARDPEVVAQIMKRRGGTLLNLDRVLLWSEPIAKTWNIFLGAVRRQMSLEAKHRELAICIVARVTKTRYEWGHHLPEWQAGGGTPAQEALLARWDAPISELLESPLFDTKEKLAIEFSYALSKDAVLSDELRARVLAAYGPEHFVELTTAVAAYNMVARVLIAGGVETDD